MFDKKKQKEMPFDESVLEHLLKDKVKYATRIYLKSFDRLFKINPYGVVSDIENNELIQTFSAAELAELYYDGKAKFYREKSYGV
jgi:hypothetical protein